ncbi:S-adenosyl-L-methionine dependent methyltransferase [Pilatotrama ljubarskyi]|nr:S-adenosyl-L-methionine dependent methyltransferase [Pilatotrama ljubarskyi]
MHPSAAAYTNFTLRIYDFLVLFISNYFIWGCPTGSVLLPFYQQHLGESAHIEIGVGTGYYPASSIAQLSKVKSITLLDLNPNTLEYTRRRVESVGYKGKIETLEQSVFDPLPVSMRGKFDSAALFYTLHCLPVTFPKKAADVFARLTPVLAPGGVVYGSTILGKGVAHSWPGRLLVKAYNRKGMFANADDSEESLRQALQDAFEEYDVWIVGVVALFSARGPKKANDKCKSPSKLI